MVNNLSSISCRSNYIIENAKCKSKFVGFFQKIFKKAIQVDLGDGEYTYINKEKFTRSLAASFDSSSLQKKTEN